MDPSGIQALTAWVVANGYALFFILMFIEGPAATAAGGFAAALGYFDPWIVLVLSVLANLIPDGLYYAMGYWGRHAIAERYGRYLGITKERMERAEKLAQEHSGKSLIAIKTIPFLATPGLIAAGATRMNLKVYAFWSIAITLPTSLLYMGLGYYFGAAYDRIERYLHLGAYVIGAAVIIILVVMYIQRRSIERFIEKSEKK